MEIKSRLPLGAIAGGLYLIALMVPALVIIDRPIFGSGQHDKVLFGFTCLSYGWIVFPPWLANPLLLFAAIALACRWPNVAAVFSFTAILLGLSSLFVFGSDLRYPHVGFFLWMASIVLVFIAAIRQPIRVVTVDPPTLA